MQQPSIEAKVQLAIQALNRKQFKSERHAAATYSVPRSTIQRRRAGTQSRRDSQPNSKKLTLLEEEVLVRYVLNRDLRS